jgi:hypothetical protein
MCSALHRSRTRRRRHRSHAALSAQPRPPVSSHQGPCVRTISSSSDGIPAAFVVLSRERGLSLLDRAGPGADPLECPAQSKPLTDDEVFPDEAIRDSGPPVGMPILRAPVVRIPIAAAGDGMNRCYVGWTRSIVSAPMMVTRYVGCADAGAALGDSRIVGSHCALRSPGGTDDAASGDLRRGVIGSAPHSVRKRPAGEHCIDRSRRRTGASQACGSARRSAPRSRA